MWEKIKQFKRWIIAIIFGATAMAAPLVMDQLKDEPVPVTEYITAPENNAYKIGSLNYDSILKEDITAEQPLKYQLDDKFISFKPLEMKWDGNSFKVPEKSNVLISDKEYLYKDVFGNGIDIDMNFGKRIWQKVVKINTLDSLGEIPKDVEFLEIVYEVETNFIVDGWNKRDDFKITEITRLGDFSYIEPAVAWDSYSVEVCEQVPVYDNDTNTIIEEYVEECETLTNRVKIKSFLSEEEGQLYLTKQIPVEWLKSAQYPIYTDTDVTYGTASEFESALTESISVVEADTNSFVVLYEDEGTDDIDIRAATVDGNTISWGTDVEVFSGYIGNDNVADMTQLDTDKVAIAYCGSGSDGFTRIVTISGTTITLEDSALEFETGDMEYPAICAISSTKFVIAYQDDSDSDNGKVRACTIDGSNAISCGTIVEFNGDNDTEHLSCAKLDTDKFIVALNDELDSDKGKAYVGTLSGTTITLGSSVEFQDSASPTNYQKVIQMDTDKFVVIYWAGQGKCRAATVSGDNITFGTVALYIGYGYQQSGAMIDSTHFVGVAQSNTTNEKGQSFYGTVDWGTTSITLGSAEEWEADHVGGARSGTFQYGIDTALISVSKIVICYQNETDSGAGQCIIGDTPSGAERRVIIIE